MNTLTKDYYKTQMGGTQAENKILNKILSQEKKEPMKNVQWQMTQRKMTTHNDDTKAKEFLARKRNQ